MTPEPNINRKDDAVGKTKIRTTINPGEVLTVDDAELLDLERQGLVKSREDEKKTDDKKGE